jgi:hypothetical protein
MGKNRICRAHLVIKPVDEGVKSGSRERHEWKSGWSESERELPAGIGKVVTLSFGQKTIFDNLNLVIRSGECLVLLGLSGAVKALCSAYYWRR